ncbi:hypothetical protein JEQ12_001882 [Ovis aries]|uniref:Keratin-associated protein n=1 Tax=Ovis aries TaxID=9940 RepID=A0A836D7V9_SHEEP|nr:hypothetical protein JEQ12_001882 [Ovis aries]
MASSALSVCSSDLSYGSRVCLPGSCDSYTGSSWQVDDCPESCCEPPCCAPSCCTPAPRLTLLCAPSQPSSGSTCDLVLCPDLGWVIALTQDRVPDVSTPLTD